jgi:hypothetical protein
LPVPAPTVRARHVIHVVIVVVAFALLATPAGAASTSKPYEVTLSPSKVQAGVTVGAYSVTLTNRTGTQQLGSAEITAPTAFTLIGPPTLDRAGVASLSGHTVSLRDLALPPGASVTVTVGVRMPCVAGDYSWAVQAKQSNDFNGPPGNTLGPVQGSLTTTVEGTCSLRFAAQPADAKKNAQIRAEAFQPVTGPLVSVEALDASGQPLTWFEGPVTLSLVPTTTYSGQLVAAAGSVTAGVASFVDLRIDASGVYNLRATTTAAGFLRADSKSFQVVDIADACDAAKCTSNLAGKETTATVTGAAGTDSGLLLLSLNLGPNPSCAGYTPPSADWFEFRLTADRDKTVVATYSKAAMRAVAGPSSLEICFAAPKTFAAKGGPPQPFDYDGDPSNPSNGAQGFVGLLPDCPLATPCILKRAGTSGGGATVTFFVQSAWDPSGDPRFH